MTAKFTFQTASVTGCLRTWFPISSVALLKSRTIAGERTQRKRIVVWRYCIEVLFIHKRTKIYHEGRGNYQQRANKDDQGQRPAQLDRRDRETRRIDTHQRRRLGRGDRRDH